MEAFNAKIKIIGVNPYVLLPPAHLKALFEAAGRDKGPIPVKGLLDEVRFKQTLVKYQGAWRLYLNIPMRRAAGKEVGDRVSVRVLFDPKPRVEAMPRKLERALGRRKAARDAFERLTPSRKNEILRYLNSMKTEASLSRNVEVVVRHLVGEKPPTLGPLMRSKPALTRRKKR